MALIWLAIVSSLVGQDIVEVYCSATTDAGAKLSVRFWPSVTGSVARTRLDVKQNLNTQTKTNSKVLAVNDWLCSKDKMRYETENLNTQSKTNNRAVAVSYCL